MTTISFLLLVLFWSQIHTFGGDAVQIQINPARSIALTMEVIKISCLQESQTEDIDEVTLLELSRKGHDPLVHVSKCGQGNFNEDSSQFQVVANIAKHPGQSYLNVTLMNPETDDTGIYTCSLYYKDRSGHMKMETASDNLLIENIDVKSLEKVLTQMGDKIASLEMENKDLKAKDLDLEASLKQRIDSNRNKPELDMKAVQNLLADQEQKIESLNQSVTYRSAFFANNPVSFIAPAEGQVIKFPKIMMMEGGGYDNNTGVFTSPRTGLYTFTLTVTMWRSDQWIFISLKVNKETMSTLYARDEDYFDQSSVSMVTRLEKGDTVKPVVSGKHSDGKLYGDPLSYFSGCLIQPL